MEVLKKMEVLMINLVSMQNNTTVQKIFLISTGPRRGQQGWNTVLGTMWEKHRRTGLNPVEG